MKKSECIEKKRKTTIVSEQERKELDEFVKAIRGIIQKHIDNCPIQVVDTIVEIPILKEPLPGFEACPGLYYGGLIVATLRLSNGKSAVGFAVASPNEKKPDVTDGIRIALIRAKIAYRSVYCGMDYGGKVLRVIIDSEGNATLGPKNISEEMMGRIETCLRSMSRCNL